MSRYPWTRQKRFSTSSMPAAVERSISTPSRLRFTSRIVVRPIEIIDSNRLDVADRFEAGVRAALTNGTTMSRSPTRLRVD